MENFTDGILSHSTRQKFTAAVDRQNKIAQTAIQSLDSLNDQIVQYIFTPKHEHLELEKELLPGEHETLQSSMGLIRRLLQDAQAKFRKMVEDNKQLAAKIDGSICAANHEVSTLRAELEDTNKKLMEMTVKNEDKIDCAVQVDGEYVPRHKSDEENELIRLTEENTRLETQTRSLSREVEELRTLKVVNSEHPSYGELKLDLIQTKQDLNRAKEALTAMKADRKRLKGEKLDLLNQMKQLYGTLEDKEAELRDFIRNFEQRMRESDESIKQLAVEKDKCECEKWEIIQKARDAAERAVMLRAQLDAKEQEVQKLEADLTEAKEQLSSSNKMCYSLELPGTPRSMESATPTSDELPPYDTPPPSANHSTKDECFHVPTSTPKNPNGPGRDRSDSLTPLIQMLEKETSKITSPDTSTESAKKKKRIGLGSISRVFSRGKTRRSIALPADKETEEPPANSRITLLNSENYQEKLKIIEQLQNYSMSTWKANQVLAWLEIVLNMPMYGKKCATNVKSGKVLLGLSDSELASALDIKNPMHRKKLRLAIEEKRNPAEGNFPKEANLDHTWVSHKWLHDLGLSQYTQAFEVNLVDGRMLNHLSKKSMEKYCEIHRKFHQASILHGVELLRRIGFDKEVLNERRSQCENVDKDPLVWSNQRVMTWVQNIDLEEFSDNLKESGVHGALMVLEPTFTADTLATALGIPPSKCYIRRHLTTEMEALVKPARDNLSLGSKKGGTLGRSSRRGSLSDSGTKQRMSLRGSLGRAFGRKVKDEMNSRLSLDSEGESPLSSKKSPRSPKKSAKQRASAPPVVYDDIPEPIRELDATLDQIT